MKKPSPLPCPECGCQPKVFWLFDFVSTTGKCWFVECGSARCAKFWARRLERGKAVRSWNQIVKAHKKFKRLVSHEY